MFNLKDERSSFEAWRKALKISRKLRDDPRGKLATKGLPGIFRDKMSKVNELCLWLHYRIRRPYVG